MISKFWSLPCAAFKLPISIKPLHSIPISQLTGLYSIVSQPPVIILSHWASFKDVCLFEIVILWCCLIFKPICFFYVFLCWQHCNKFCLADLLRWSVTLGLVILVLCSLWPELCWRLLNRRLLSELLVLVPMHTYICRTGKYVMS